MTKKDPLGGFGGNISVMRLPRPALSGGLGRDQITKLDNNATFKFIRRLYNKQYNMTVKLNSNEVVLKAGDTNQIIDNKTVNGKLIVTNQRIYFKSLAEETSIFNLEILFENILEVIFYNKGLFQVKGLI